MGLCEHPASLPLHPAQAVQTRTFKFTASSVLEGTWQGEQAATQDLPKSAPGPRVHLGMDQGKEGTFTCHE